MGKGTCRATWVGLAIATVVTGAWAADQLPALMKLQPGQWQLKEIGSDGMRSICLADPAQVLQVGHGDGQCARTVLDSAAGLLTVNYTCPGRGHGRSTLTYRSPTSFRLQTQGLADGAPFDFDYDAHRTGDCASATPVPAATPVR